MNVYYVYFHILLPVSYSVCPTGVWGKHCSKPCQCQNEGVCDSVNGGCDCPPGWIGSHCEVGENIPQLVEYDYNYDYLTCFGSVVLNNFLYTDNKLLHLN